MLCCHKKSLLGFILPWKDFSLQKIFYMLLRSLKQSARDGIFAVNRTRPPLYRSHNFSPPSCRRLSGVGAARIYKEKRKQKKTDGKSV
jgi:hypothetical protein